MKELKSIPRLNPIARYFLNRYKARLLDMPCTRETSSLVDATDYLLESERKEANRD